MNSPNDDPDRTAERRTDFGTFGLGLAPDLRRMLAVLASGIEALEKATDMNGVDLRAGMQRAIINAARLTNELAALERRRAGPIEAVDLASLVEDVAYMTQGQLPAGASIGLEVPASTWRVRAVREEIEAAIAELVRNAAEAIGAGGHIAIKAANLPSSGAVRIEVVDDGSGIDEAILDQVALPFFSTKTSSRHPGLGLTRALRFARKSGGRIEVRSRPGGGCRVVIELPRATERRSERVFRIGFSGD